MILNLPLQNKEDILKLKAGDVVYLNGTIYTDRDAAHKRLVELIANGEEDKLPIELNNGAIYYVGPTPTKPGRAIGSAGPTSSYRMDPYSKTLMEKGLKIMIGKGSRSEEYKKELVEFCLKMHNWTTENLKAGMPANVVPQKFLQMFKGRMNLADLQSITGINRKQLNHYVTGYRKPSQKTVQRIQEGIRKYAEELSRISLV